MAIGVIPDKDELTTKEVAAVLGCTTSNVLKLKDLGHLEHKKYGPKTLRITRTSLEAYLDRFK